MIIILKNKYVKFLLFLILCSVTSSALSVVVLSSLKPWENKPEPQEKFNFYNQKDQDKKNLQESSPEEKKEPEIEKKEEEEGEGPPDAGLKMNYSLAIYKGRICERMFAKEQMVSPFINTLKRFKQNLPQDIILYETIVPSSGEFYFPKKITNEISNKKNIEKIYEECGKENIKTVNLYETFKNNKDKYIYFKTDHHWTQLGAYYAYKEFGKTANLENTLKIENLKKARTKNFLGSLFKLYPKFCYSFWANQDFIEYYDIKLNNASQTYMSKNINPNSSCPYSSFFSKSPESLLNNSLNNKRKILVIGDSFKDCFLYFLSNDYQEVIDFFSDSKPKKYLSVSELLIKEQIKEILIMFSANNINGGKASKEISLLRV